jgi:hypothetical protein
MSDLLKHLQPLLAALVLWLALDSAGLAHMKEHSNLDQWLASLASNGRGSCCDGTEAAPMVDPAWRNASEMKKGECEPSDFRNGVETAEDLKPAFCVRLQTPNTDEWHWWVVPAIAVVETPNRAGPALIWLFWGARPYIRCFLPGGGV